MTTRKRQRSRRPGQGLWSRTPEEVRRFLDQRPDFEQLCSEVAYILSKRLRDEKIEYAAITHRTKTLKSFLEKLDGKHYDDPFAEITDFSGVRVVCLYLGDVERIEGVIRNEFSVIEKVDKLSEMGADRFGYGALHFIVTLGSGTTGARYDELKALRCEVQVRTVLQDAWAIIDHHLVYKHEADIPSPLQRKLNSLAGLFETADDQFGQVRTEREKYVAEIRGLKAEPAQFLASEVNQDSLREYLVFKFPETKLEYFDGQISRVLELIPRNKYVNLKDIDRDVTAGIPALTKLTNELGPKMDRPDRLKTAAAKLITALALLPENEGIRKELGRGEIKSAIEKYVVSRSGKHNK